ncbi:MAG: DUF368 domain-containing protein [Chloroflexales bacterium]|nr:DUF368 domain-containing protein [Chloroflexales bacterium]
MTDKPIRARTPLQFVRLYFTGIAMGIADLIPGVSGGTMAFILGIYAELLDAIKSFNLDVARLALRFKLREAISQIPLAFLVVLVAGIGSAAFSLAHLMSWLLENQPIFLFSFFFGLILASILAVGAHITWLPQSIGALIAGAIGAYIIVGAVPLDMPHDPLTLFLSGSVAIMAMILPGISGSFILLILGQYDFVLTAVKELDILTLIPVGLGAVLGLMGFSRVLSWLLKQYHNVTVAVLVGFMIGSLRVIWPWKEILETRIVDGEVIPIAQRNILPTVGAELWLALLLCIAGFLIVTVLDHMQSRSNPVFTMIGMGRSRDTGVAAAD